MLSHEDYLGVLNGDAPFATVGRQCENVRGHFAGSFNPVHAGHLKIVEHASERLGGDVALELSLVNVDKPPLTWPETQARLEGILAVTERQSIVVTSAARFEEKIACFSPTVFIVGADTISRVSDARYYGESVSARDRAISRFVDSGCRFLVYGRLIEAAFVSSATPQLPANLLEVCDFVPEGEFRVDISSTSLRSQNSGESA
ncbi:MAG: hypothetical protein NXI22_05970 [bacterium]|nr:hypothetical protein [bacterium]